MECNICYESFIRLKDCTDKQREELRKEFDTIFNSEDHYDTYMDKLPKFKAKIICSCPNTKNIGSLGSYNNFGNECKKCCKHRPYYCNVCSFIVCSYCKYKHQFRNDYENNSHNLYSCPQCRTKDYKGFMSSSVLPYLMIKIKGDTYLEEYKNKLVNKLSIPIYK